MVKEWASLKEQMLVGDLGPLMEWKMDEILVDASAALKVAH